MKQTPKRMGMAIVAAFAAVIAVAQTPYFETFEVRLHNLEVVVTDREGNPVHGLTKEDFIVRENGVEQNVTNFSMYDSGTATVRAGTRQVETLVQEGAQEPAPEPAPPPRRVIFFVDDMAVRKPARKTLIRNATGLVDQLGPGDLAAVIRPTGANRVAQPYTTDMAAVRNRLTEAIESCKLELTTPGQFELIEFIDAMENARTEDERRAARGRYRQRAEARVKQRLSQLRALVGSLAAVEGRKILVVITSGLPSSPGRDAIDFLAQMGMGPNPMQTEWGVPSDFRPFIDELARTAAANGVTIYALEPEAPLSVGVQQKTASSVTTTTVNRERSTFPGIASSKPASLHVGGQNIAPPGMIDELQHYAGETLTSLAERTGGKWFRGVATIDDVFRQIASDLRVYYSLAYRATGPRDKPRRVAVTVRNRPELIVRTRTEVIDRSPEREMGDQVMATLLFPRDLNELHIDVSSGKPVRVGRRYTIPLDVVIPLETMTFVRGEADRYVAVMDIHFAAAGDSTDFTMSGNHRQNVEVSAQQYGARAGTTYRFKTTIEVAEGPTRIAIGVMDAASRLAAFRTLQVEAR
jgi:VWFA-related protein